MTIRALVVDDEPLARSRMRRLLGDHPDVEVVGEAADGAAAHTEALRLRPDVVFLDVHMPGSTGTEALRAIQASLPESLWPLAVFTTAYEEHAVEAGAVIGGVTDFTAVVGDDCEGCGDDDDGSIVGWLFMHIWLFLAALLTGSVLIRITGPAAGRTSAALLGQPGRSLGLGFVAMIVIPVASLMAIGLVIPMPLGFIGLALYGIAFYVTGLIAAHAVGRALMRRFTGRDEVSPYASLAVGLLVVQFFLAIPFVGFLARMAILSAGLGALWVASQDQAPETVEV
ncbi:MAG: response regulator [Myxococcota bacterium]|jgi:CheY-like chemotaxis protein|nr:response regulator [Myxococcota bacterium]